MYTCQPSHVEQPKITCIVTWPSIHFLHLRIKIDNICDKTQLTE